MKDRTRLVITGAAALAALGVTMGGHGVHFNIGDDDDGGSAAHRALSLPHLRDFDGVALSGPDDILITQGARFSVKAEGAQRTLDRLNFFVANGTLHVERKNKTGGGDSARIRVILPALHHVSLTGSGDMKVDKLVGKDVKAQVTGPGNLTIEALTAERAQLALTGTGDLSATGKARTASLSANGSGDIAAGKLETERASLKLIGSGDIFVRASRDADISIVGSGGAHVAGTTRCTISRTGAGDADCTS